MLNDILYGMHFVLAIIWILIATEETYKPKNKENIIFCWIAIPIFTVADFAVILLGDLWLYGTTIVLIALNIMVFCDSNVQKPASVYPNIRASMTIEMWASLLVLFASCGVFFL